jgi:hypothetical protein
MFCHLIHVNAPVIDLDKKLYGALQPDMQAAHAGSFDQDGIIQIPQVRILQPGHQKSSAEGIRL